MTPPDLRVAGRRLMVALTVGDIHMALLGVASDEHRDAAATIRTLWDRVQHLEHQLEMIDAERNAAKCARA